MNAKDGACTIGSLPGRPSVSRCNRVATPANSIDILDQVQQFGKSQAEFRPEAKARRTRDDDAGVTFTQTSPHMLNQGNGAMQRRHVIGSRVVPACRWRGGVIINVPC